MRKFPLLKSSAGLPEPSPETDEVKSVGGWLLNRTGKGAAKAVILSGTGRGMAPEE